MRFSLFEISGKGVGMVIQFAGSVQHPLAGIVADVTDIV
jgi:hypothetical protein